MVHNVIAHFVEQACVELTDMNCFEAFARSGVAENVDDKAYWIVGKMERASAVELLLYTVKVLQNLVFVDIPEVH